MIDTKYCKDCKNMNCPESRVNCKYPDAIACDHYRDTPPTVFQQITASPEVLADKLVYRALCVGVNRVTYSCWKSTITEEDYRTRAEAIAATVARLKRAEE